jgi:pimeloyl-ACP methyl ester carboxylesterase
MVHSSRGCRVAHAIAVGIALVLRATASHAQIHLQGDTGPGSTYEIDVPDDDHWNRSLVLYAHGLLTADQRLEPPSQLPEYALVRNALLASGFAVAASSYSGNGWALADAVRRTHQVTGIFADRVATPRRTFVIGASMGALVALKLADTHARQYDGALAMCGPLGGALAQVEYVADARVTFDYYFDGLLPATAFHVPEGTSFVPPGQPGGPSLLFLQVAQAMALNPAATMQWASAARLPYRGMAELADSALFVIGASLRATNDLIERVNGKLPYDNRRVQYEVTDPFHRENEPFLSLELNAGVARFDADMAALDYYERNYTPSGRIGIPVVTLSTSRDPWIPAFHERLFRTAVAKAGRSDLLVQHQIDRWGHCAFTVSEATAAFDNLVRWVETGVKP